MFYKVEEVFINIHMILLICIILMHIIRRNLFLTLYNLDKM